MDVWTLTSMVSLVGVLWMPPSLVPTKQIENYKIYKENEKKIICNTKKRKKMKRKKTKNPEFKLRSHLGPKLELRIFLHNLILNLNKINKKQNPSSSFGSNLDPSLSSDSS